MATSERGQRTRLVYGGVAAEVSLVKTSAKPTEAEHEVRRMIGDRLAGEVREEALREHQQRHQPVPLGRVAVSIPVDSPVALGGDGNVTALGDPIGGGLQIDEEPEADPFAGLPEERIEHGVHREDGSWVDLTGQLATIDKRTKIDGMEIVATIASTSVPRYRVRDSHWVGLAGDQKDRTPAKVLALLWRSLRETDNAAVVKWTKRANQALGVIVALGRDRAGHRTLCLLELEWTANLRHPGPRASMPLDVETSNRERAVANQLAEALRVSPGFLESVRDERNGKRAELLEAAREGRLDEYEAPPVPATVPDGADLAEQLAAAAAVAS